MACKRCEGISKYGSPCKRKASCQVDCYDFCWQHAEKWNKTKGCTGKKLYQYRKKSGPKTGKCGPDEMIGVSGRCVKRTPANLRAKKKALGKRKLGKRGKRDDEAPPFIKIEEGSEESDDEMLEIEELSSDERELRVCRDDMSLLRQEYVKERRNIRDLEDFRQKCVNQNLELQNAYDFQLAQATAKEQEVKSCRANLEQLRLEYESRKKASLRKLDKLQEEHNTRLSELVEQKRTAETYEAVLNDLRREYQEQNETNKQELAKLRLELQDQQRELSEKERQTGALEEEIETLNQRLVLQGVDGGRVERVRDQYKEKLEQLEKDTEERRLAFASLFQQYSDLKESGVEELQRIREEMSKQKNALVECQKELKECESGLEILDKDYEQRLADSKREVKEIEEEYELQRQELSTREAELKECNEALKEQADQFEDQQEENREKIKKLEEDVESQKIETFDKDLDLSNCLDAQEKLKKRVEDAEQKQIADKEGYRQSLEKAWKDCNKEAEASMQEERRLCDIKLEEEKEKVQRMRENYQLDKNNYEGYIKTLESQVKTLGEQIERLNSQYESNLELARNKSLEILGSTMEEERQKCQEQIKLAGESERSGSNEMILQLTADLDSERKLREELVQEYEGRIRDLNERYVKDVKKLLLVKASDYQRIADELMAQAKFIKTGLSKKRRKIEFRRNKIEEDKKSGKVDQRYIDFTDTLEKHLKNAIKRVEEYENRGKAISAMAERAKKQADRTNDLLGIKKRET